MMRRAKKWACCIAYAICSKVSSAARSEHAAHYRSGVEQKAAATASALAFWNPESYSGRRMINHPHTGQARPPLRASSLFG